MKNFEWLRMRKDLTLKDDKIGQLIRPPRYIYRHPAIRLHGLTHVEQLTETLLKPNGDAARDHVLAEMLQPAGELR